jgi:hypothetical protein
VILTDRPACTRHGFGRIVHPDRNGSAKEQRTGNDALRAVPNMTIDARSRHR